MRVIAKSTLREFREIHEDAKEPLNARYKIMRTTNFKDFKEVTALFTRASVVKNHRVVFRLQGNKYRLIAHFKFFINVVYICFVGTHDEYDKIDATTVCKY